MEFASIGALTSGLSPALRKLFTVGDAGLRPRPVRIISRDTQIIKLFRNAYLVVSISGNLVLAR